MSRSRAWTAGFLACSMMGLLFVASPGRAAEQSAPPTKALGNVNIVLGPSFVQQMFKAGLFVYGSSSVRVAMSGNQSLSVTFPLDGTAKATPTSLIQVDGEAGGMDFYNGPMGSTAGLAALVVRRTGSTGFISGTLIGPFSMESGQFEKTMPVFAMSSARAKTSSTGWTMTATLTLTEQGAETLNTLLETSFFPGGARIGSLRSEVRSG
ncbi:MAG: hypothetical protein HQ453_08495 [Actinobacteria bacterium]|nr:hypothetical protein [Actinomycetota bacterium]